MSTLWYVAGGVIISFSYLYLIEFSDSDSPIKWPSDIFICWNVNRWIRENWNEKTKVGIRLLQFLFGARMLVSRPIQLHYKFTEVEWRAKQQVGVACAPVCFGCWACVYASVWVYRVRHSTMKCVWNFNTILCIRTSRAHTHTMGLCMSISAMNNAPKIETHVRLLCGQRAQQTLDRVLFILSSIRLSKTHPDT